MSAAIIAFEQDVAAFMLEVKSKKKSKRSNKRSVPALIKLWDTYESSVHKDLFNLKLLMMGDFLQAEKEFGMAAYFCFGWYLQKRHSFKYEEIFDTNHYITTLFSGKILNELTLKALMSFASCMAFYYIDEDPCFQISTSNTKIEQMLKILQQTSEMAVKKNAYCWLVFNCTLHIYNICMKLMLQKLSMTAIDYLIWCCVCMESSVPLMTVKYLKWRTQLYIATSECYYNLNSGVCGEEFARRGLQKVIELEEIEKLSSSSPCLNRLMIFKEAFLKLKITIFKRNVIESRKHAKGLLRPKFKLAFNDIAHNKWPRTLCERLLVEHFNGRAAQFLAVIETIANKKLEMIKAKIVEQELDDYEEEALSELFFAGAELAIFGSSAETPTKQVNKITTSESSISLAAAESDYISLSSLSRFLMLVFMHEKWEIFDSLILPVLNEYENVQEDIQHFLERQILLILSALSVTVPSYLIKKFAGQKIKDNEKSKKEVRCSVNELLTASKLLYDFLSNKHSGIFISKYYNLLVDIVIFIWSACKHHFAHTVPQGSFHTLLQEPDFCVLLDVLVKTQHMMVQVGIQNVNLNLFIEAALITSMFIEQLIQKTHLDGGTSVSIPPEIVKQAASVLNIKENTLCFLEFIDKLLSSSLKFVQTARDSSMKFKVGVGDNNVTGNNTMENANEEDLNARNCVALHLELMFKQHYVATLINFFATKEVKTKSTPTMKKSQFAKNKPKYFMANDVNKNSLSKALFIMSNALVKNNCSDETLDLLKKSSKLLQKELCIKKKLVESSNMLKLHLIPPAPIILSQGSNYVILKPATFVPVDGIVSYYSIYLRSADGENITVRQGDVSFEGTGELVRNTSDCLFTVKGLVPNTAYVAAVAAFNEKLTLIGGSIGHATSPFLTINSFPTMQAFAYLTQVAYKCRAFEVVKTTAETIWKYFVLQDIESTTTLPSKQSKEFILKRLNETALNNSSTVLKRLFVQTVFISSDVIIEEEKLYWYKLTEKEQLANSQLKRINLCVKIILAIQVSAMLNDESLCVQGCVQIFELLSPIIYWKLLIYPVLQVLEYLFASLQEIKNFQRFSSLYSDPLQQVVKCITNYVSKVFMGLKNESAATHVLQLGKKICSGPSNISSKNVALVSYDSVSERNPKINEREYPIILKTSGDNLTALQAYKEVVKLKKRTDYLQNAVHVVTKAFNERSFENVIEWTEETLSSIKRRNEMLLIDTVNENKLSFGNNEEDTNNSSDENNKGGSQNIPIQTNKLKQRSNLSKKGKSKTLNNSKKKNIPKEKVSAEENFKDAVSKVLPGILTFFKMKKQRMKFRKISLIELRWRCQLNIVNGECFFQLTLEEFNNIAKKLGYLNRQLYYSSDQLENNVDRSIRVISSNLFTLGSIGVLLVDWPGSMNGPVTKIDEAVEVQNVLDTCSPTSCTEINNQSENIYNGFIENFKQACLCLKRAMVLAHRGKNWMLLQQACNNLFTYTHTLITKVVVVNSTLDKNQLFCANYLRSFFYMNFFHAADFILDMMSETMFKSNTQHKQIFSTDFLYENSGISLAEMMRVVFFAIEILFYEKKFEKVCYLIIQLNELTQGFYSDVLLPLLSYSKQYLNDQNAGCKKNYIDIINPVEATKLPSKAKYTLKLQNNDLKLKITSSDCEETIKKLYSSLEIKSSSLRSLEHSRQLLHAYLAGRIGAGNDFLANKKAVSHNPANLLEKTFENLEEVEFYPLVLDTDIIIVVNSYEKTIIQLLQQQQTEVAAQAMNELGDVFFHKNDKKSAKIWWSKAIDCILKKPEGIKSWRELVIKDEKSIHAYKELFKRCNVWGCLLVGVLAAKIAKYTYESNVSLCIDACQMSAAFFKAIFCCSLNHPLLFASYISYQIGPKHPTKHILPGINIFFDVHRINCASLIVNMIWVCKQLLMVGFYIEIQPLLTFAQYLSSQVCHHLLSAVEVKLMRISSLVHLSFLNLAVNNFVDIVSGIDLPAPADVIRSEFSYDWPLVQDNVLTSYDLIFALCKFKVTSCHLVSFGSLLCHQVSIQQAALLSALASLIFDYPEFTNCDMNCNKIHSASEEDQSSILNKKSSSLKGSEKVLNFSLLSTNVDQTLTLSSAQLRGKLLCTSTRILVDVLTKVSENCSATTSWQLGLFVQCHLELASIYEQRLLFTQSIERIYLCLQAMTFCCVNENQLNDNSNAVGAKYTPNIRAFSDLSVITWMQCKIRLCSFLLQTTVFQSTNVSVNDFFENLTQALIECKTFNDSTSLLEFEFLKTKSNVRKGDVPIDEVVVSLEELKNLILQLPEISLPTKHLLFEVETLEADFRALDSLDVAIERFLSLENDILQEMFFRGHQLNVDCKYPLLTSEHSNSQLFSIFLAIKFRSIRIQALSIFSATNYAHKEDILCHLLDDISLCLSTFYSLASKEALMAAEITLLKGKIQRLLLETGRLEISSCLETFADIISTTCSLTGDLSALQQCCSEIALALFYKIENSRSRDAKTVSETNIYRCLAWLCIHTASTISDFDQNSVSFFNDNTVVISNLEDFPEFCLEDLGKNSINLNDVVHYITQLRQKSSLYSCLETVRERKLSIVFPKGYFNPAIKLRAMHNYLMTRFNEYNEQFFAVLKFISKFAHFLHRGTKSHDSYADVYEDDCFSDVVISNINQVAVYWYTSDLFYTNNSAYLFLALSKSKIDLAKLQRMRNGDISNIIAVEAVSVAIKTVALLHEKLVKTMLLMGVQDYSNSFAPLLLGSSSHIKRNEFSKDTKVDEFGKFRNELVEILSEFQSLYGKKELMPLEFCQRNLCDLEKLLSINCCQIIMVTDSLVSWLVHMFGQSA